MINWTWLPIGDKNGANRAASFERTGRLLSGAAHYRTNRIAVTFTKPRKSKRHDMPRKMKSLVALAITATIGFSAHGRAQDPVIIGDARMQEDGTIVVNLRRTADGINLSGIVRYPTNHPDYREVLEHIGGMKPGDVRLVPAWDASVPKKQ